MLVVDGHTLRAVHLLDLVDQVQLHLARAEDAQHLVRVDGAVDDLLADSDVLAFLDLQTRTTRHRVGDLLATVVGHNDDLERLLGLLDAHPAGDLADRSLALGGTGLEELDHTR